MKVSTARVVIAVVGCLGMLAVGLASASADPPRTIGDSKVVADLPDEPGFPEGVAVSGNKMYVSAPAQFGNKGPGKIYVFDAHTGAALEDYDIPPQPGYENTPDHGLVGVALDGSGHLYVADIQVPGIVQLDLKSGNTSNYATLKDLPPCSQAPAPCSPTAEARPPFPNDMAFDKDGNLYVTDSFQATLWKVPKGGGDPEVWYQSADFDRPLGANGIRLSPDDSEICVAVTGPPGGIHCIPATANPTKHRTLHTYLTEGPDNMAFGESENLYIALGFENKVSVVEWTGEIGDGDELQRFSGPAKGPNGPVPWDAPAGVAFDNARRSLLVANHALNTGLVLKNLFVVFDIYVNDRAHPLHRPAPISTVP
jgi:hypothetical protein